MQFAYIEIESEQGYKRCYSSREAVEYVKDNNLVPSGCIFTVIYIDKIDPTSGYLTQIEPDSKEYQISFEELATSIYERG